MIKRICAVALFATSMVASSLTVASAKSAKPAVPVPNCFPRYANAGQVARNTYGYWTFRVQIFNLPLTDRNATGYVSVNGTNAQSTMTTGAGGGSKTFAYASQPFTVHLAIYQDNYKVCSGDRDLTQGSGTGVVEP